jgi:membrane protein involved in colicin uptake
MWFVCLDLCRHRHQREEGIAMKTLIGVFLAGSILFLIGSGCGESSNSAEGTTTADRTTTESASNAARARIRAAKIAKAKARARKARAARRQAAAAEAATAKAAAAKAAAAKAAAAKAAEASRCDPNYSGGCLDPSASDYDCEGGSGNGPNYTGPVKVIGYDKHDLDADGDGYGCE